MTISDTQTITVSSTYALAVELSEAVRVIGGTTLNDGARNIDSSYVGFWTCELGAIPPELILYKHKLDE